MTRQHKSRYYPSEHLRSLQAQIDELWEWIEGFSEVVNAAAEDHDSPITAVGCTTWEEYEAELKTLGDVANRDEWDKLHAAATAEVADTLKSDAFQVKHLNYGWYQVVDADDQPIHEGKLRKKPAVEAWKAAMEGARGECRPFEGV